MHRRSRYPYQYSVYQIEYSRNLIFHRGAQMEETVQGLIDRTRGRLQTCKGRTGKAGKSYLVPVAEALSRALPDADGAS